MSFRRRRRRNQPALAGLPFSDSSPDSHGDEFVSAGASQFFDATGTVPRARSNVHRLFELDTFGSAERRLEISRVWGAEPHASLSRRRSLYRVGSLAGRQTAHSPLASRQFPGLRWSAFNVLQVRVPEKERFCVSRKVRKGVLFARGVAGHRRRSPGAGGRYRRTADSQWRC